MSCGLKTSDQIAEETGIQLEDAEIANPPAEIFGDTVLVSDQHNKAIKTALQRGQHKVSAVISYEGNAQTFDNVLKKIDVDGEFKRVYFHKVDIRPVDSQKAMLTTVFHVLDNPLPLVPIVWGASIVAGATAGYFFVDKVESFSSTIGGKISIVIAGIVAYFTVFK